MKRILSLVLVVLMLLGVCGMSSADVSINTQYTSTALFLQKLDEIGIKYTYVGVDSAGYEKITVNNTDSDLNLSYTISYFFDGNNENASIRVWDLVTIGDDTMSLIGALYACNNCSSSWKYVTFFVEDDNTITAKMDLIYRGESVSEVVWEATLHMVNVIEAAYPTYLADLQVAAN